MHQPARLAELAAAETDPCHSQHVARLQFHHAHLAVAVVRSVGDYSAGLPGAAAVARAHRRVAVVDAAPTARADRPWPGTAPTRYACRAECRRQARRCSPALLPLRPPAAARPRCARGRRSTAHELAIPRSGRCCQRVSVGQSLPRTTVALVHQHDQPAVPEPAELRCHPARLVFPDVAVGDGAVPLPGAAAVRGAGGHDVGEQRGMRVGQAVGRHQPLGRVADTGHGVVPAAGVRARPGRRVAAVVVGYDELAGIGNRAHRLRL